MPAAATDLGATGLAALADARLARSEPEQAERAVAAALAAAPDDLDVRLGAYRFYFYNHRLAEALPQAEAIIALVARRLNVASDWRLVRSGDGEFGALEVAPGLYLQALLAWGYCTARLGRRDDGRRALCKVVELDPRDRFGAGRLIAVIDVADERDD